MGFFKKLIRGVALGILASGGVCLIVAGITVLALGIYFLLGALLLFALSEFGLITFTWYRVLLVGLILLVVDAVT